MHSVETGLFISVFAMKKIEVICMYENEKDVEATGYMKVHEGKVFPTNLTHSVSPRHVRDSYVKGSSPIPFYMIEKGTGISQREIGEAPIGRYFPLLEKEIALGELNLTQQPQDSSQHAMTAEV